MFKSISLSLSFFALCLQVHNRLVIFYYFCNWMKIKQLIAFLLLTAFTAQTFGQAITVANFYIHQDYIAKTLCVNKDKPQMKCCGKCQLSKKIKQEEKQDQQNPERKESKNEVLSSKSFFPDFISVVTSSSILFKSYPLFDSIKMPFSIFHPPQA